MPDLRNAREQANQTTSDVKDTAGGSYGFLKGTISGAKSGISFGAVLGSVGGAVLAFVKGKEGVPGKIDKLSGIAGELPGGIKFSNLNKRSTVIVGTGVAALAVGAIGALVGGIKGAYRQGKANGKESHAKPVQQHAAPAKSEHAAPQAKSEHAAPQAQTGHSTTQTEHAPQAAWANRAGTLEQRQLAASLAEHSR